MINYGEEVRQKQKHNSDFSTSCINHKSKILVEGIVFPEHKQRIIDLTKQWVENLLKKESSGHDWGHTYRVWQMAKHLNRKEGGDSFIIEISALLHDVADWKLHGEKTGPRLAKIWLRKFKVDAETIAQICDIIENLSFKAAFGPEMRTMEGKNVQDADKLDAIGATGTARAFAYGGFKRRIMHDPAIKLKPHRPLKEYKEAKGTTINHFYEKLLLLKDKMNTKTAKKIAEKRHKYMQNFLERFLKEWDLKL